jgi:hypothetical protein
LKLRGIQLIREKGWTKITVFNDLDAMGDEDWDKVCERVCQKSTCLRRLTDVVVLDCQRKRTHVALQGGIANIQSQP